jgi:hypothetical protein
MFDVGVFSFGLQSVLLLERDTTRALVGAWKAKNPYILYNYEVFLKFFL